MGAGLGAGDGVDTAAARGDRAGFGVGVAVGAGIRDEAGGDDGVGVGYAECAAPAGTLAVAAVDRRTAQVTSPQYVAWAWARPAGPCSSTTIPEPPSSTRAAIAHVIGCPHPPPLPPARASQDRRRLPPDGGSGSGRGLAESSADPVGMCPLP